MDAKRALLNSSGLGSYSRNLINALSIYYPENEYHLFSTAQNLKLKNELLGNFQFHFPNQKLGSSLWRSFSLPQLANSLNCNVYHGLSNELPFTSFKKGIKKVVTIHDLIFEKYPSQYSFFDRKIYRAKSKNACQVADTILACSEETKQDIIDFYKIPSSKIQVVYQSCHPSFYNPIEESQKIKTQKELNLPDKFILHIGSFNIRKNQLNLLRAYARIQNQVEENLILIGNEGNQLPMIEMEIKKLNLQSRVKIIKGIANSKLAGIYCLANLFVFPSFYEGFGIPVLEAMACGTKVLSTAGGCFEEVGGKQVAILDPYNTEQMGDCILKSLQNVDYSKEKLQAKATLFSPKNFAENTRKHYL